MVCRKCGEVKTLEDFRIRDDKLQQSCKKCALEYGRRHYRNNKPYYVAKAKKRNDALLGQTRQRVWNYLAQHPCVDCGHCDPRVLEFDHVNGEKTCNISDLKQLRFCWKSILDEIAKCEARCANCHRIKTFSQFGWFMPSESEI